MPKRSQLPPQIVAGLWSIFWLLAMPLTSATLVASDKHLRVTANELPPACADTAEAQNNLQSLLQTLLPLESKIAIDLEKQRAMVRFLEERSYKGWCADYAPRTSGVRATGPIVRGPNGALSYGTHARARVFYSNEVVRWLQNDRQGGIPDGAMIVKEMYPYPSKVKVGEKEQIAGWAVMVRDRASSYMGWIWGLYFEPANQTFLREYMTIQPGLSYCTTCHASADNSEGTFSFLGNLYNQDVATYVQAAPVITPDDSLLTPLQPTSIGQLDPHDVYTRYLSEIQETMYTAREPTPLEHPNSSVLAMLRSQLEINTLPLHADLKRLPLDFLYDRKLPQKGVSETFYTSSACVGCHNAANLLNSTMAHGQLPVDPLKWQGSTEVNVTPYGEWQGSMMAMSGRDPIFRAQLEWEAASIEDKTKRGDTTQLCMSCHSVMAERVDGNRARELRHTYDFPGIDQPTHKTGKEPDFEFAALARDGVSCTVCHRMSEEGLGKAETFTAQFKMSDSEEVFGPFKNVKTKPMQNAVGLTPVGADHIKSSALCGSCHTIHLPVLHGNDEVKKTFEQTTYLEWLNSEFAGQKSASKSCQDCHMSGVNPTAPASPLDLPIANIEDSSFPYVPNRAPAEVLDVESKPNYRRHTLVGANLFGLSMFQQFPDLLGAHLFWPGQDPSILHSRTLAIEETRKQVQTSTAALEITDIQQHASDTLVQVKVTNLAGHKLPTGVGFRRAFLEFALLDQQGKPLWCSGCTNDAGVIVDRQQQPLASEFARTEREIEPDRLEISSSDQVQIYESRTLDCDGAVTTSFMRLCNEIKDNRLLPRGWRRAGPYAKETAPVAQQGKLHPGQDQLTYRLPTKIYEQAADMRVTLNYQAIPPHYLVDRFRLLAAGGDFPELRRLLYMVLHLDTESTRGMSQWKTPVACIKQKAEPPAQLRALSQSCIKKALATAIVYPQGLFSTATLVEPRTSPNSSLK